MLLFCIFSKAIRQLAFAFSPLRSFPASNILVIFFFSFIILPKFFNDQDCLSLKILSWSLFSGFKLWFWLMFRVVFQLEGEPNIHTKAFIASKVCPGIQSALTTFVCLCSKRFPPQHDVATTLFHSWDVEWCKVLVFLWHSPRWTLSLMIHDSLPEL